MAEPYNMTLLTGKDNLVGTIQGVNEISGGIFGMIFLLLFFIILFVAFKNYEFKRALAGSSLITSIVAMLFRLFSFVNDTMMFSFFLVTAIAFIWMMWGD